MSIPNPNAIPNALPYTFGAPLPSGDVEYNRLKQWFNLYLKHRSVPASTAALLQPNKTPSYYRIFIQSISRIPTTKFTNQPGVKPFIKITATFYNRQSLKFYGRTYTSPPLPLVPSQQQGGSGLETAEPINLFFYSTIDRNQLNTLVMEATLLEIQDTVLKREIPLGWTELEVYIPMQTSTIPNPNPVPIVGGVQPVNNALPNPALGNAQFKTYQFYEGTTRELLQKSSDKLVKKPVGGAIAWKTVENQDFKSLALVIDEAVLVGPGDVVPGLEYRALPNLGTEIIEAPKLSSQFNVLIENVYLKIPPSVENQVVSFARHLRSLRHNMDPNMKGIADIFVKERKMIVIYHNTWTAVNARKFDYNVSLIPNKQTPGTYSYSGSFPLDSVFWDDYGIVCFQLEYQIVLPLAGNNVKPDEFTLALGWCPIFIKKGPSPAPIMDVKENFVGGPGKALNGEKLFEWNISDTEEFEVACVLNFTKAPRITGDTGASSVDVDEKTRMVAYIQELERQRRVEKQQFDEKLVMLSKQPYSAGVSPTISQNVHSPALDMMPSAFPIAKNDASFNSAYTGSPGIPNDQMKQIMDIYKEEATKNRQEMATLRTTLEDVQKKLKDKDSEDIITKEKQSKEAQNVGYLLNHFTVDKVKDMDFAQTGSKFQPVTQPQFNERTLSRADMAMLLQAGVPGLLDKVEFTGLSSDVTLDKCVRAEMADSNKASNIFIHFLAVKPSTGALLNSNFKQTEGTAESFTFPSKIYFTFNFFNFPTKKTDAIMLQAPKNAQGLSDTALQAHGIPFYLIREQYFKTQMDPKEPIYSYEIDPSLERQSHQHVELVRYFWNKALTIEIWDADSLMLFGSVKIPMRELCRQGKPSSTITKEFEIIEPSFMRAKGGLQIQIKNVGKPTAKEIRPETELRNKRLERPGQLMSQTVKKKIKSKNAINLQDQMKQFPVTTFDEEAINNPEYRKQERINRYKLTAIESNLINEANTLNATGNIQEDLSQAKSLKQLREITNFRDTKKQFFLKNVMSQHYDEEKYLNVSFAKTEVFSLEIANFSDVDEAFSVIIEDPDGKILPEPEVQAVYSPDEWKHWVERKGFTRPAEWNMIVPDKQARNSYTIFLKKADKCEVLFKFLTFRAIDEHTAYREGADYNEALARMNEIEKNEEKRKQYITPRSVNITVSHLKGRVITGMKINIEPHASVVDHVFRFFEQENRHVQLNLPALYYQSMPPMSRPKLALTYENATFTWLNDKEVALELKVPPAQSVLRFNLLAYDDPYYSDLMGNWIIEVNSCAGVDLSVKVGQATSTKLVLPPDIARLVKMYVSHPTLAYFPNPFDKPFTLTPGPSNSVSINARIFNVKTQHVLVNCVDVNTHEKIYQWIVKLIGSQPQVTKIISLDCKIGLETQPRFIYENRSAKWAMFEFVSSNPEILDIFEKSVPCNPGDRVNVRLRMAKRDTPGTAEVCVYASDVEEKIFDCILFKIKYGY
jgi:nephrocystin-4